MLITTCYNPTFSYILDGTPWIFSTRGLLLGRTLSRLEVWLLSSTNWKLIFPWFSVYLSLYDLAFCFLSLEGKVSKTSGVFRMNIRALHTTSTTTIIIRNRITAVKVPTIHPSFSSACNTRRVKNYLSCWWKGIMY